MAYPATQEIVSNALKEIIKDSPYLSETRTSSLLPYGANNDFSEYVRSATGPLGSSGFRLFYDLKYPGPDYMVAQLYLSGYSNDSRAMGIVLPDISERIGKAISVNSAIQQKYHADFEGEFSFWEEGKWRMNVPLYILAMLF